MAVANDGQLYVYETNASCHDMKEKPALHRAGVEWYAAMHDLQIDISVAYHRAASFNSAQTLNSIK